MDHAQRECNDFTDVLRKDIEFFLKMKKIYLKECETLLKKKLDEGEMKILVDIVLDMDAFTYAIGLEYGSNFESWFESNTLWSYALKDTFPKEMLFSTSEYVCQTT